MGAHLDEEIKKAKGQNAARHSLSQGLCEQFTYDSVDARLADGLLHVRLRRVLHPMEDARVGAVHRDIAYEKRGGVAGRGVKRITLRRTPKADDRTFTRHGQRLMVDGGELTDVRVRVETNISDSAALAKTSDAVGRLENRGTIRRYLSQTAPMAAYVARVRQQADHAISAAV